MTREEWLTHIAMQVEDLFGEEIPLYRISCGWPSRRAVHCYHPRVAECHSPTSSKGGYYEIFISPAIDDSLEVAGCIVHELCHVVAGIEEGHGKKFKLLCDRVGLTRGKPSDASPGDELTETLERVIKVIGPYPHQSLLPALMKRSKQ